MEMTIARGRWQEHLKSGGDHYHALARELEALPAEVGADVAALAYHALAELLERCRAARLTRNQHVLLRLGALIARAEGAAAFARRAQRAADRQLHPKAVKTLRAPALAAASRVYARDAALTIATEATRLVVGAGGEPGDFGLTSIHRAQSGLLDDMQTVSDALYARKRR
jgi:alkylation response protein AidB-like acyl-CoA dehydrogenase